MAITVPTLEAERELLGSTASVIGCDEVGRGAIAGPVGVGMAVVTLEHGPFPEGLRDSKTLTEIARERMHPLVSAWAVQYAVGYAEAEEIEEIGIIRALGVAGRRALVGLHELGVDVAESIVLLDGSHDWLTPALSSPPRVAMRVKADRDCASVSAAALLAKVARDRRMIEAADRHPHYGWAGNKGYASSGHYDAIEVHGTTDLHRHSWIRPRTGTADSLVAVGG